MSQHTPLHEAHVEAGGKLVDFAGWQLPVHYGSLVEEHKAVRGSAGMFDVSHMTIVDFSGAGAEAMLRRLLTNDVATLEDGRALYSCLCNEQGGVLDDLIVYRLDAEHYRVVVNAATRDKDLAWFDQHKSDDVELDTPAETALIAVQGPEAIEKAAPLLAERVGASLDAAELRRFSAVRQGDWFVARTGYTGEDGLEIALPAAEATAFWNALSEAGVQPCGLGARDTLRLEAGMCLYGSDLDEAHSPVESGLAWTVDLSDEERDFIGREVVEDHKLFGGRWHRIGLTLDGRGVLRGGQTVQLAGTDIGVVTSGTFSPSRQDTIAMARVNKQFKGGCDVIIRDRPHGAQKIAIPFVRPQREID